MQACKLTVVVILIAIQEVRCEHKREYLQDDTVKTSNKILELFSQMDNNTYTVRTEIANNEYNSVLCWLETVNLVEYRNGTQSIDRQFSIILETPADLANKSLDDGEQYSLFDETRKSRTLNFTTVYRTKNFTVKVNKTLICGTGPVITKEYIAWPSDKKRVQINLGTKKILENYAMETLMRRKYITPEKIKVFLNKDKSSKVINNRKTSRIHKSVATHTTPPTISDNLNCSCNHVFINNCRGIEDRLNIRVQVAAEYQGINETTEEVIRWIPLTNVERVQDFNIRLDSHPKFKQDGDVDKTWERFVKLLMREYLVEYLGENASFHDLPVQPINTTHDIFADNKESKMKICCLRKVLQTCEGKKDYV